MKTWDLVGLVLGFYPVFR